MNKGRWSKIFGWAQFGFGLFAQVVQANGVPHGAWNWVTLAGQLAVAVAMHGLHRDPTPTQ